MLTQQYIFDNYIFEILGEAELSLQSCGEKSPLICSVCLQLQQVLAWITPYILPLSTLAIKVLRQEMQ